MNRFAGVSALAFVVAATPALAGGEVRYEAAPDWVQPVTIDKAVAADGPSEVLFDWQHRLEGGVVQSFNDRAVRIDNLQALTSEGTLQMAWAPDKGDLLIHHLEIWRGDEVIDLVAEGVKFEILRRERGLEQRLLDGRLTATVAVPGMEIGDILRVAHSITVDDQALGDEMQAFQPLPADPFRVGTARAIISWPTGAEIWFDVEKDVDLGEPIEREGYSYVEVALPIAKREEMPSDAPWRFKRPAVLRVGSFENWEELSRVMEPHFTEAAQLKDGSALAVEAQRIMGLSDDPLKRTELAVRLVQDKVSYLLNGLDGGNYLPQSADETWEKRYGDCKAKSVLLLALLREMGIASDVVLVQTRGGDAVAELLPLPGSFDHMIVRANVGGVDYWLDGTSTATRLANMAAVPAFHYALPLTPDGAGLVPITDRSQSFANLSIEATIDHSAGIDLPPILEMRISIAGPGGANIKTIVDEADPEVKKRMMRSMGGGSNGIGQIASIDITYDDELAVGTMAMKGVGKPGFKFNVGRMENSFNGRSTAVKFSPNRIRPKWRGIPVAVRGPSRTLTTTRMTLPDGGAGFVLEGDQALEDSFARTRVVRKVSINGDQLVAEEQQIRDLGEVAVADLAEARRAALRIEKSDLTLVAPENAVRRWELSQAEVASRTAEARALYDIAVEQADDDDFSPLIARAGFFNRIFDFASSARDLTAVIEQEPTERLYLGRAELYESLGELDAAIFDAQSAYDLAPDSGTAFWQARMLARSGRQDEALDLLDLLPVSDDEIDGLTHARAIVLGLAGRAAEGRAALTERLDERANSASLLNAICWVSGLHELELDDTLDYCTRGVERASSPANVLDSRAMVHFRRGDMNAALEDIDAALKLNPELAPSRYLRGLILLAMGDDSGQRQVEMALRQAPELRDHYALYGVQP